MISSFRLKFGSTADRAGEEIDATPITVFVGPNNSGKSKVLTEIDAICRVGYNSGNTVIMDSVSFKGLNPDEAASVVDSIPQPSTKIQPFIPGHVYIDADRMMPISLPRDTVIRRITDPASDLGEFASWYLRKRTLLLNGQNRIALVNQQGGGDLQQPPTTSLQSLFRDDTKRQEVRRIVYEAFGKYFVIDPTHLGHLRVRLSETAPQSASHERGLHAEALAFHESAQPIEEASDGVRAFTGIIAEIVAGDPRVVLIDEPEAFLHPSLAHRLGLEVARAAQATDKRVFVSTHSPNFVMGCIQSGAHINIIRLTYRKGVPTARLLPSHQILELMRNPLLRSTNVLNGLFFEYVVVAEADTDRAFYQEINERLLRFKAEWGVPNCLFLNAQNKQTVPSIVGPLRKLGIPTAGVVDVDVLKEGGTVWANQLDGVFVPVTTRTTLGTWRSAVRNAFEGSGKDMSNQGGLAILDADARSTAEELVELLSGYGLFVVSRGELEHWLPDLNKGGHGSQWLIKMFEVLGEDPDSADYVRPGDDDVWLFISQIKRWLEDTNRKGIPS